MIVPPADDMLAGNNANQPIFDIFLNVSQWIMVATLIILINKAVNYKWIKLFFGLAVLCLSVIFGITHVAITCSNYLS